MVKLNSKQWTNYWQKGTLTTFHKKFENNYDGEIKKHWNSIFKKLVVGSTVVDLATGNGALLYLLDNFAKKKSISFNGYGIDFAEINKEIMQEFNYCNVELRSLTLIEKTGLPKNSIDCAISQYGFEYANMIDSVKELDRILKPTATISFIMHTNDSQLIKEGFKSLEQIELVTNKLKVNDIIKKILPAIDKLKKTGKVKYKIKADKLRNKLNNAMKEMMTFAQTLNDPGYIQYYYENALSVFKGEIANRYSLQEKLKIIKLIEKETNNLKHRMQDLTTIAMTKEGNERLVTLLKNCQFNKIKIKQFRYDGTNVGQVVTARRG